MLKTFLSRKFIISIFLSLLFFTFAISAVKVLADTTDTYGLDNTATNAGLKPTGSTDITVIIGKIIGVGLSFVGVIFLILIIYAGFKWMTAGGDSSAVGKAQQIIIAATVGLIIVVSAYAITSYLGTTLSTATK